MIKIRVPATSANLGSGFDTAGIALNMYNEVYVETGNGFAVHTLDNTEVPRDRSNLIYTSFCKLYERRAETPPEIELWQRNDIPMERGLGSSAACIVAGLLAANELMGKPYSRHELLDLAARIEGHPDNVAPAFLGGMTAAAIGDDKLFSARFDIKKDVCFAAFIPPFPLLTSFARACMPKVVPLSDAVYNLSRCSLLCSAFALGRYELLSEATKDKLHQPYRLGLIEGGAKVFEMANSLGAFATFISGAGSTVLSAVPADNAEFFEKIETVLASDAQTAVFEVKRLEADNVGATVEKTNGFN